MLNDKKYISTDIIILFNLINKFDFRFFRIQSLKKIRERQMIERNFNNEKTLSKIIFFVDTLINDNSESNENISRRNKMLAHIVRIENACDYILEQDEDLARILNIDYIKEFIGIRGKLRSSESASRLLSSTRKISKWNAEQLDELCKILEQIRESR